MRIEIRGYVDRTFRQKQRDGRIFLYAKASAKVSERKRKGGIIGIKITRLVTRPIKPEEYPDFLRN